MAIDRIIIDFDDTLFDTLALKEDIKEILAHHGINQRLFDESYQAAKTRNCHGDYDFGTHLSVLEDKCIDFEKNEVARDLEYLKKNLGKYLSAEADDFLEYFKQRNIPLILLTVGDEKIQRSKISQSKIEKFFHKIRVVNNKAHCFDELAAPETGEIVFINDKIQETKEVLRTFPHLKAILKIRRDISLAEYQLSGLPYFKTLDEILINIQYL